MDRLLIISNRLPVSVSKDDQGLHFARSVGGVATGLSSLESPIDTHWIGWSGIADDELCDQESRQVEAQLTQENCTGVPLSEAQVQQYYLGFSNRTIWPLFHYFFLNCEFDPVMWDSYREANEAFADQVVAVYQEGDFIWIQDYQLMLLPQLIRQRIPEASIGFFLHIPFPSFELLRLLPWASEVLHGMLGADLIGFHEYDYVRHFLSSVYRIAGVEHHSCGRLSHGDQLHPLCRLSRRTFGAEVSEPAQAAGPQ